MLTGRHSSRLAMCVGFIAGWLLIAAPVFAAAPVFSTETTSHIGLGDLDLKPSSTPDLRASPEQSGQASASAAATPSPTESMSSDPQSEPTKTAQSASPVPTQQPTPQPTLQATTNPAETMDQSDSLFTPEPEISVSPAAVPEGIPSLVSQEEQSGLSEPMMLIVAGSGGLCVSTVGIAVMLYRRKVL